MPTLEFFGYEYNQQQKIINQITPSLKKLDFANTIVFLLSNSNSVVLSLDGSLRPLIRIHTRYEARAKALLELLQNLADVEVAYLSCFQQCLQKV